MRDRRRVPDRVARAIARCILNFELHPITHFILNGLCFLHLIFCIVSPQSQFYAVLRWIEPSTLMNPEIILYVFLVPIVGVIMGIILQIWWAIHCDYLKTSIVQHYWIKLTMTVSCMIYNGGLQPVLRASTLLLIEKKTLSTTICSVSILILLFVIFVFRILVMHLSPQFGRIYAYVTFPNALFLIHIARPILAILSGLESNPTRILIFFMLPLIAGFLLKFPILSWRYNTFSQLFASGFVFLLLIRCF